MSPTEWSIVAGVVMVVGLCGVVIPILPGLALIWATALVYGFAVGFGSIGWVVMAVLTILVVAGIVKSMIVPKREAEAAGASGWAQLGGLVGAVAGFFTVPVVGIIIGALTGVMAVEWLLKGDLAEAWTATKGTAKGFGLSVLIDFGIGLAMIATWMIWAATVVF